ncbi:hypothetical protein AGMMS50229_08930 [Campylobacterota bacterium]|nr:hypothetical protein AGMMS50229_08930 [Campylobacterota bacterium]
MRIKVGWFLAYKALNSLFAGLSLGALFVIYADLEPSVFSIGGLALAVCALLLAQLYAQMMNVRSFFAITALIEVAMLVNVAVYLVRPNGAALAIYCIYQFIFVFGSYLLRAETLFLSAVRTLTLIDSAKQIGYIAGLGASALFYSLYDAPKTDQVWLLHTVLFALQATIVAAVFASFTRDKSPKYLEYP